MKTGLTINFNKYKNINNSSPDKIKQFTFSYIYTKNVAVQHGKFKEWSNGLEK